ncbi:hypothetical protein B5G37_11295 [Pseudoflavonifractor sp. An85]|nr:hypothetical protein B5G37_11295 [Pseudoflavonifractor sp. An85]
MGNFERIWADFEDSAEDQMGTPPKPSASGFGGERRSSGMSEFSPFGAEMRDMELATTKSRIKAGGHPASHNCPQCGQ